MSRLFTELTVGEMKQVLDALPDPVNYSIMYGDKEYKVREPLSEILRISHRSRRPVQSEYSIYRFKVVEFEWMMI